MAAVVTVTVIVAMAVDAVVTVDTVNTSVAVPLTIFLAQVNIFLVILM